MILYYQLYIRFFFLSVPEYSFYSFYQSFLLFQILSAKIFVFLKEMICPLESVNVSLSVSSHITVPY